ncbi:MAG: metallophosphoesterase [Gemmatimonadota bacterium]|nr:metallophosphoesterase [Gemmatimonadota bacterium]
MIVAHLSDLHLGFRAYGRVESEMNIRERDVSAAFERAVGELVRIGPDVVVVAGDVFDRPDPPAGAVVALARGLELLRSSLSGAPVLMVAGPRDTPRRSGDPGALAVLDTFSNVEAATGLTRSILIDRLDLHACLVPHRAAVREPPVVPEPDPTRRWNLLVLHAHTASGGPVRGVHVEPDEWDYVALGGEHRAREVTRGVRYAGSLERVALDPWDEAADEKGFVTVDVERGEATFHRVRGRPVVALAPIKVGSGDPDRVRRRVREVADEVPGGIEGKIVRVRLEGAVPSDLLALQGTPIEELRDRALHLAVEVGREPRVPAEAWLPTEAVRRLRDAVEAELMREGSSSAEALDRLAAWLPEEEDLGSHPVGRMEVLEGTVPGLGRISTSIPEGLTAVFGGGSRTRRAVAEFVRGRIGDASPLGRLWQGIEAETLDSALRLAVEAVAASRGLTVLDAALDRAGVDPDHRPGPASDDRGDAMASGSAESRALAEELDAAERELKQVRADAAEVDGDLEAATMDWLRERQDAETTLQAYRDRARELRARLRRMESAGPDAPCPTCGRVLAAHYEAVLAELKEEWEAVVQDGSWWRSRWAQLELKPEHLRDLEGRAVRLHAAIEAGSERVEILRNRLAERGGGGASHGELAGALAGPDKPVVEALGRVRAARLQRALDQLLDRASRFLCRISGGRILAVTESGGRAHLQGTMGVLHPLSEEDLAAARLALRLAAASLTAGSGRVLASFPVEEPFDRLDSETRSRTLSLLKALTQEIPRMILITRGAAVDARPELFNYLLEARADGVPGGPVVRPVPSGPGWIELRPTV